MRITAVINSLEMGGAERVLTILANAWSRSGISIHIITFTDERVGSFFKLDPTITRHCLNIATGKLNGLKKFKNLLKAPYLINRALKESAPDLILSFMDQANMLTLLASPKGIPVIVCERCNPSRSSIHNPAWPVLLRSFLDNLRNLLYRRAKHIVLQTSGASAYFPAYLSPKIKIIPNPIEISLEGVPDIKLPPNSILALGRLCQEKRLDLLIDAFSRIHNKYKEWSLHIVGSGPLKDALNQKIKALNLEGRVSLHGATTTAAQLLSQAKIYVLSSESEGFPQSLLEALACQVPAIACDCNYGPRDMISHQINGILVPPNDPQSLANALEELISDPEKRRLFGEQAGKITERFSIEQILKRWEEVFKDR